MSDLNFNSMAGAVLASLLGIMGLGIGANAVVQNHYPEKPGWLPEVVETPAGGVPQAPAGPPDFGRLFADEAGLAELIARGERFAGSACKTCHTFEAGGANGTGPNLHDAFGRGIASGAGFTYTGGMMAMDANWDYLHLNDFLRAPSTFVPGTRMTYNGIRNDRDRTAVIAYLRSISPNSVPLPAPLPEAAPVVAAPSEGEAPPPAPAH
jgi:cytochrome c